MAVKDLQPGTGNHDLELEIVEKGEVREFEKFGKQGRVCSCRVKDETGECSLTLWNEQVDQVKQGDKIKITNGWCTEFRGDLQVSTGKFGKLEVIGSVSNNPGNASEAKTYPASEKDNPNEGFEVEEEKF